MSHPTAGEPSGLSNCFNDVLLGSLRNAHSATWNGARPALTTFTPITSGPGGICLAALASDSRTSRLASFQTSPPGDRKPTIGVSFGRAPCHRNETMFHVRDAT